ncbi:MAG: GNAT family N-acetyltransferase [Phormidesmis sp.]
MPYAAIRPAEVEDLAVLPEIERAAAREFLPYVDWLNVEPKLLEGLVPLSFLQQAQTERRLWVAVRDRQVVGFVVIKFLIESCFIVELDVCPEHWRKGIGSALVEACCASAKNHGFSQMTLTTFRKVPWNIPFYQEIGFALLAAEDWPQEVQAIVRHEARYGFAMEKRAVMARSLKDIRAKDMPNE